MRFSKIVFAAFAALAASCTSQSKTEGVQPLPTTYVPVRLAHEFYSSWGHDGRGGAALRKPAYQHVMGSEEMVMTTHGNYLALQNPNQATGTGSSVLVTAVNSGVNRAIDQALTVVPPPSMPISKPVTVATEAEYLVAYRKFCAGAGMALTEREWELVAKGGPHRVPPSLRGKCMRGK